ncbi:MAG: hypothetical protein FVQ84_20510 [Planctomycetes bacterium]|nr:hypothetical protein [Planctomycetota bacterium]
MADSFQKLCEIAKPDPRSEHWAIIDPDMGKLRMIKIEDIYSQLEKLELHTGVPKQVRTHFDTTRNLFLYSWFVYRFMPVAEWHASASLELALKIKSNEKKKGLRKLIELAIENGWIKNEGVSVWKSAKQSYEQRKVMMEEFFNQIKSETTQVYNSEFDYDYIEVLKDTIPPIRNVYAHGKNFLHGGAYLQLQIVSDFINQLFED